MKINFWKKVGTTFLAGAMLLSCTAPVFAASSADNANNTSLVNDLANSDIIDSSKTGSISIYKYDMTSAEAAGVYTAGNHNATGEEDTDLEAALAAYAVEGVEFTYLRLGDIETYSYAGGSTMEIVYEIPDELRDILNLDEGDAIDMANGQVSTPCSHTGVGHYTSQQLNDSLKYILETDNVAAKDELEAYVAANTHAVKMGLTDKSGYTGVSDLELGLYLLVETRVPEQVVATVNPWFVSLPFTNEAGNWNDSEGGQQWLYDITCYPKNQTGNPTLDKMVRNAHGEAAGTSGQYEDYSRLVYNAADADAGIETGSDEAYVAARDEYVYNSTVTASEGDVLDYILVSRLPHIEDSSTYLTEYTFVDTLSRGLTYNKDVRIAFYNNADDANVNNTVNAEDIWTSDEFDEGYAEVVDTNLDKTGETQLTVRMTEKGLAIINDPLVGYADHYMVVYYTVTVNSNATTILGDEGNPNDVTLTWRRTSDTFFNTLEDKCEVYTFGLNLTKTFSDNRGDASKVQFKLYNASDAYYVEAEQSEAGLYYVIGKTADQNDATVFSPAGDGKLFINGIEGDTYQLTEIATDNGYSLLKDQIVIVINSTSETIIPSVAGTIGLEAATAAGQNINQNYAGGIIDATGTNVSISKGNQAEENANGRTIGKTAMYEGEKVCATAVVDGIDASMSPLNGSADARVDISIINSKSFLLPQTGGTGLYMVTIFGVVIVAIGCVMFTKRKKDA